MLPSQELDDQDQCQFHLCEFSINIRPKRVYLSTKEWKQGRGECYKQGDTNTGRRESREMNAAVVVKEVSMKNLIIFPA